MDYAALKAPRTDLWQESYAIAALRNGMVNEVSINNEATECHRRDDEGRCEWWILDRPGATVA